MAALLRTEELTKIYRSGKSDLVILDHLQLEVETGEMVAITGESGSGKSTLLHILGALDSPTQGEVYFEGRPYSQLSDTERDTLRNRDFGFVWQFHFLLPEFSALENVMMPLLIRGVQRLAAKKQAEEWLKRLNLVGRADHRTGELSGGEQQRVALARALITKPKLLLADEPTGNLDNKTAEQTIELMQGLHREDKITTLVVTHNMSLAQRCDRGWKLENGRLQEASYSSMA
ncbi:MAG: ABC transporter ATP-binding protein [Acidobacteria bacterium RIFCSPLOWO2_12_FULL_54_10]|nr:MAG: ABC transporter ATP-binding protein [Acidobacteria bacterium RIFCSPLOWO2_12_FULL_54_10]